MNRSFIYIFIGATLWGTIGFYVKKLYDYGFSPMEVVTIRVVLASIILLIYLIIKSPSTLKLDNILDLKYFIGTGIISIIFFNYCMFKTIELATIPISAALLYTAPAFVIIISYFLFRERITWFKTIALLCTLIGTSFVVGLFPIHMKAIPFITILIGLGSGLGYALYSIFSKFALEKYSSLTITTYTFIIASIVLIPFFPYRDKFTILLHLEVFIYALGLGLLPTAIAYIVYTLGLEKMEASKASIIATIEPIVATIIGIIIFFEPFNFLQLFGMILIIFAVIIIQIDRTNISVLKQ